MHTPYCLWPEDGGAGNYGVWHGRTEKEVQGIPWEYATVTIEKSADLSVLAMAAGIKLKMLKDYNPELRQSATPADGLYSLKLPKGSKTQFTEQFNALLYVGAR